MKGIAVFGAGRMGAIHAGTIARSDVTRLVAISDPRTEVAEALASRHDSRVMTEDEVFASTEVDAIVIASAAPSHAELIGRATEVGKAIFCEKPIGRGWEQVKATVARMEAADIPFMLGLNRRFDRHFIALKRRIDAGDIGTPEQLVLTSRDPSPPPIEFIVTGGGIVRETSVHDLDMACWLTGDTPHTVFAIGACLVDPEIGKAGHLDTIAITLQMSSGATVQINNSWRASYRYDQRVEVHGSLGMAQIGNVTDSTVAVWTGEGVTVEPPLEFFLERYAEAYVTEMNAFLGWLAEGKRPTPDARDGLLALKLAEAAAHSIETGQPVTLSQWEPAA